MKSIREANITPGLKVLVRADLDVPIENGEIREPYRLEAMLPTLKYIIEKGAIPVLMGHMGRPDGKPSEELSTKKLMPYFNENLGEGKFELLENIRFNSGEETNDQGYANSLASLGDIYVNECFSASHRPHASIVGVPMLLPAYAGLNLEKEVETLSKVLKNPARPLIAIIGGAKLDTKKPVISKFVEIADLVLLGGRMGNNWNAPIPQNMRIPRDYAELGRDIGPVTIKSYSEEIKNAKTIVWAGPLGAYEEEKFALGTKEIAEAIIDSGCFSVVGGGDTVASLNMLGLLGKFSFASTGGSAMLDFISEGNLPGLEVLGYNG